jgi:hypothetical protein
MPFVNKGTVAIAYGVPNLTPTYSGAVGNNLLISPVYWSNPATTSPPGAPAGWTTGGATASGFACFASGGYSTGVGLYWQIAAGGSASAAINASGSGAWAINALIAEFSGYQTSSPQDSAVTAFTGSAGPVTSGTITSGVPAQSAELIIVVYAGPQINSNSNIGLVDPISGFTTLDIQQNNQNHAVGITAYKEITGGGAQSAPETWGQTGEWAAMTIGFKALTGAGGASIAWVSA